MVIAGRGVGGKVGGVGLGDMRLGDTGTVDGVDHDTGPGAGIDVGVGTDVDTGTDTGAGLGLGRA